MEKYSISFYKKPLVYMFRYLFLNKIKRIPLMGFSLSQLTINTILIQTTLAKTESRSLSNVFAARLVRLYFGRFSF